MSFNQNTKINNLYQIIEGLSTDISGLSSSPWQTETGKTYVLNRVVGINKVPESYYTLDVSGSGHIETFLTLGTAFQKQASTTLFMYNKNAEWVINANYNNGYLTFGKSGNTSEALMILDNSNNIVNVRGDLQYNSLSNKDYVYAYQDSFSSSANDIPGGGGSLYIRNFTAQLGSNFQYNGISTFTCNNTGTYLLSFQNSFVNNVGITQSNCDVYFEINGTPQERIRDSVPLLQFSNNSQTIRKTLNAGDLIKIYVASTDYIRITNTTLNIIKV